MASLRSSNVDRRVLLKRGSCGFNFEKFGATLYSRAGSNDGMVKGEQIHSNIVCEVLDSNTQTVVSQSKTLVDAADWCVSNDLVAKLLAMVMENRELASLIQELVGHDGQQLYVHPASRYSHKGEPLRFFDIMMRVRAGGEIALGYVISNSHEHGGTGGAPTIVVNPPKKAEVLRLRPDADFIITLGYNTDVFTSTVVQVRQDGSVSGDNIPSDRSSSPASTSGKGNNFTRKAKEKMTTASRRMKGATDSILNAPGFEFVPKSDEAPEK